MSRALRDAAERLAAAVTGVPVRLRELAAGPGRAVFAATGGPDELAVKAYDDRRALAYEVDVLALAAGSGVPVPEVLAFEPGPPAVTVMTWLRGSPLASAMGEGPAVEAGAVLRRLHALPASPPFSGGQRRWDEFVQWWAGRDAEVCRRAGVLSAVEAAAAVSLVASARDLLSGRPTGMLHGDLQADHVLVDGGRLTGLIDLVDAQPGDALLDVAVLTLWDHALTPAVLRGCGQPLDGATAVLLSRYRLVRHLGAAAWLIGRDEDAEAGRHAVAVRVAIARE